MAIAGGPSALRSLLRRHRRIAIDSSVFIYLVEENTRYVEFANEVFLRLEEDGISGVTSAITFMELMVRPYMEAARQPNLVGRYYALLTTYPRLDWFPTTLDIADSAARLRAQHRMKTPDAIQAATAVRGSATVMITNDPVFERVDLFQTIVLDRFVV